MKISTFNPSKHARPVIYLSSSKVSSSKGMKFACVRGRRQSTIVSSSNGENESLHPSLKVNSKVHEET